MTQINADTDLNEQRLLNREQTGDRADGRNRRRTTRCGQTPSEVERAGRHRCGARGYAEKLGFASWPCFYHSPPPSNRGTLLYRLPWGEIGAVPGVSDVIKGGSGAVEKRSVGQPVHLLECKLGSSMVLTPHTFLPFRNTSLYWATPELVGSVVGSCAIPHGRPSSLYWPRKEASRFSCGCW